MTARNVRTLGALLLVLLAILVLASALLGRPWPGGHSGRTLYLLADRSESVAAEDLAQALTATAAQVADDIPGAEMRIVDFAAEPSPARPVRRDSMQESASRQAFAAKIDSHLSRGTNIAAALRTALGDLDSAGDAAILLLSDGNATAGDMRKELEAAATAGVAVLWHPVAGAPETLRIAEVRAPAIATIGQEIPVVVRLVGTLDRPLEISVGPRGASTPPTAVTPGRGESVVKLRLRAATAGPLVLDATLRDPAAGNRVVDERKNAALVDVRPRASVLYVANRSQPLERSLRTGGWTVELVSPRQLDELAPQFGTHSAVILDDVPVAAARDATWRALLAAVRGDGTGLIVLGGARSFAAGGYRGSVLESALPVLSQPAATGDGTSIVFAVDKSGSMGASAAGVDRFALAQRAVADSARSLVERDAAAVVAFDVEARTIVPLLPAEEFRSRVAQPWPVQPRGGTQLAPAIDAALSQFEALGKARRILVLVTDGFVGDAPLDVLRTRLQEARVEIVALAIGPDADVRALQDLGAEGQVTVLRVAEAAELPALMREGLETRRAQVQREASAVRVKEALPFLDGSSDAWPAVAAYAVTMARPDATTYLQSTRGDPLLAYRQFGTGRVVAITSGLDAWTPQWLAWAGWPKFAGGLVDWSGRNPASADATLQITKLPDRLHVTFDSARQGQWAAEPGASLRIRRPSGRQEDTALQPEGPGRVGAFLEDPEPGLYLFTVVSTGGTSSIHHLQQPVREFDRIGPNPELVEWEREGLLLRWSPDSLQRLAATLEPRADSPRYALLLAMLLFVAAVGVDRGYLAIRRAWSRSILPKPWTS